MESEFGENYEIPQEALDAVAAHPVDDDVVEYLNGILVAVSKDPEGKNKKIDDQMYHLWNDCAHLPAFPVTTPYESLTRDIRFIPVDNNGGFMVLIRTYDDEEEADDFELLTMQEALTGSPDDIGNEREIITEFYERRPEIPRASVNGETTPRIELSPDQRLAVLDASIRLDMLREFRALVIKANARTRFESGWFYKYLEMYGEEMLDLSRLDAVIRKEVVKNPGTFLAMAGFPESTTDNTEIVLPPQEMPDVTEMGEKNTDLRGLCVRTEFFSEDFGELELNQQLEMIRLQKKLTDELETLSAKGNKRTRGETEWFYYLQKVREEPPCGNEEDLLVTLWNETGGAPTVTIEGYYSIKQLPEGLFLFRDGKACELLNLHALAKRLEADNIQGMLSEKIAELTAESEKLKGQKKGLRRNRDRIDELGRQRLNLSDKINVLEKMLIQSLAAN